MKIEVGDRVVCTNPKSNFQRKVGVVDSFFISGLLIVKFSVPGRVSPIQVLMAPDELEVKS
jgi:hypothetical protein